MPNSTASSLRFSRPRDGTNEKKRFSEGFFLLNQHIYIELTLIFSVRIFLRLAKNRPIILTRCLFLQFFISRVAHGSLSAFITLVLIKLLNIPIETIGGAEIYFSTSRYSWLFGVSFIMLSIFFMIAVRKNNKII